MGRSLEFGSLQTFSSQNPKESTVAGVTQSSSDTFGIADKLQFLHLEDHGDATKMASHLKSDGHRRPRMPRWSIRVRRRRVRLQASPLLGYLRSFRQSCMYIARSASTAAYRMDSRLPGSKLGLLLAKLHFSSKRARRIHSISSDILQVRRASPASSSLQSIWTINNGSLLWPRWHRNLHHRQALESGCTCVYNSAHEFNPQNFKVGGCSTLNLLICGASISSLNMSRI